MDKKKMRIIAILVFALFFSVALFGVLYAEEFKRAAKREEAARDAVSKMNETEQARKQYYDNIAAEKQKLREQMAQSKQEYEDLLDKQPDIISQQKQSVTKVTQEVVPVTTEQAVTTSKPTSTKSTKTS